MSKISLVQKKIIKSLLYGNYDLMGIYFARIYTLGKDSKFWLYSGLEGALIYCIDLRPRVLRFLLFNLKTYEIVFDCELYKKFNQSFQKGTDTFFYFDVNDGYIGFEIPDLEEAASLEEQISSYNDDLIKNRLKEIKHMKENELKEKGRQMIKLLSKKYNNNSKKQIKSEIILNQNELENSINTINIDEDNEKLILAETGHIGLNKELKKIRGLELEENKIFEENEIFSKYIARNFLTSLMKGLIVPKRKIDRNILRDVEIKEIIEDEPKEEKENVIEEEEQKKEKEEINEQPHNEIIEQSEPQNNIIEQEEPKNEIIEKEEPKNEIIEKEEPKNEIITEEESQREKIEQEEPQDEIIENEEPENKIIEQEEHEDVNIKKEEPEKEIIAQEEPNNEIIQQVEQENTMIEQEEPENKNIEKEEPENKLIEQEEQRQEQKLEQEKKLNENKEQTKDKQDYEEPKVNPAISKVEEDSSQPPPQSPSILNPIKQPTQSKLINFAAEIAERKKKIKTCRSKRISSFTK